MLKIPQSLPKLTTYKTSTYIQHVKYVPEFTFHTSPQAIYHMTPYILQVTLYTTRQPIYNTSPYVQHVTQYTTRHPM